MKDSDYSSIGSRMRSLCLSVIVVCAFTFDASGITARRIASGLNRPVYVTSPAGDTGRLFILEQHTGRIKILNLDTGLMNVTPFLDIDGLATGNEQGLFGLAFDPNYAENGFFYVNFTESDRTTNIRRYQVSANDPDIADPASGTTIIRYSQPFSNHNGGWIGFGPDGYLYICAGDGGSGNDPGNRAQDITNQKLGKILRLDVGGDDFPADATRNYSIPPDNPFVGIEGDDEIWAYGLRNPWRAGFDRLTGDFYIADVGQNQVEEINFQPAASTGGENYGWRVMEGNRCNFPNDPLPCNDPSLTPPIHAYLHSGGINGGQSVSGGYVYRGPIREIQGVYFFADFVSNQIWSFRYDGTNKTDFTRRTEELAQDAGTVGSISSFGEDAMGNLYICDLGGEIFKIVCDSDRSGDFDADCDIDSVDYAIMASAWLTTSGDALWNPLYDISDPKDGIVNMLDLEAFAANWLADFRLAAHWKLDETQGSLAGDSAGDNDGTLHGGPMWRPSGGMKGGALELDGVDDYVEIPSVLDPADGSFTVEAWIKGDIAGRVIISQTNAGGPGVTWLGTEPSQGRLMTELVPPPDGRLVTPALASDFVLTDGLWHNIAFVWDGAFRHLYVDGNQVAKDGNTLEPLATSQGDLHIGAAGDLAETGFWSGLIDQVRIYDRTVTPLN
jgi:glucose/arabinose dehydrogenase